MCGVCSRLGVNIHTSATEPSFSFEPHSFSLDPYAGGTFRSKPVTKTASSIKSRFRASLNVNGGVITYTFLDKDHLIGIYNNKNNGFTADYGLSPFSEAQRTAARDLGVLWDDLISLTFKETNGLGADIQFSNSLDPGQAYAYYPQKQGWKFQSDVFVADPEFNVTNKWFTTADTATQR